jgi:hypothetical protein
VSSARVGEERTRVKRAWVETGEEPTVTDFPPSPKLEHGWSQFGPTDVNVGALEPEIAKVLRDAQAIRERVLRPTS